MTMPAEMPPPVADPSTPAAPPVGAPMAAASAMSQSAPTPTLTTGTPEEVEPTGKESVPKEATVADLRSIAEQYMVPMSDGTLEDVAKSLKGKGAEAFTNFIKQAAVGLYPALAPQIQAGIPTILLLDPYRQVAKQMLGDDFEPDFVADPKSSAVMSGSIDPKTNRPTMMTLDQWKQHIKSTPEFGWASTPAAQERAQQIISALQQGFEQGPSDSQGGQP